jgi:FAD-linked oxidoreductase
MPKTIRNWGRSWSSKPREIRYPHSEEEVATLLKEANASGRNVRIIGSGHSWTQLVPTDDILVSLDRMQGLIRFDKEKMIAEVWAGTKLLRLGNLLHENGAAMMNLGDIDVQSIAGALSTGTHGTGRAFGTLATQLAGLTLVTGNGDILECSPEQNPEIFKAAQISLGALGIITRMKLQAVPMFKLEYVSKGGKLRDAVGNFDTYIRENRNYEFYWFPFTDMVQFKFVNETDAPIQAGGFWREVNDVVIENLGYAVLSDISKRIKSFTRPFSKFSAKYVPKGRWVNHSHKIFATKRWVKFYEMEYNVPEENFKECFAEVRDCIHTNDFRVHMPMEVRYVKGDDIMISPANGRNCVYMAVHQFKGMQYKDYFAAVEKIFQKHGGRPHFGKMNTMGYEDFKRVHPNWDRFIEIRNSLDPKGVMLNNYLRTIFNINPK